MSSYWRDGAATLRYLVFHLSACSAEGIRAPLYAIPASDANELPSQEVTIPSEFGPFCLRSIKCAILTEKKLLLIPACLFSLRPLPPPFQWETRPRPPAAGSHPCSGKTPNPLPFRSTYFRVSSHIGPAEVTRALVKLWRWCCFLKCDKIPDQLFALFTGWRCFIAKEFLLWKLMCKCMHTLYRAFLHWQWKETEPFSYSSQGAPL